MENLMKSITLLVLLPFFFFPFAQQVKVDEGRKGKEVTEALQITISEIPKDSIFLKIDSLKIEVNKQIIKLEQNNEEFNKELKQNMDFSKKINTEMMTVVNKLSKKVNDNKNLYETIEVIQKTEERALVLDSVCVKKSGFLGIGRHCKKWELVLR